MWFSRSISHKIQRPQARRICCFFLLVQNEKTNYRPRQDEDQVTGWQGSSPESRGGHPVPTPPWPAPPGSAHPLLHHGADAPTSLLRGLPECRLRVSNLHKIGLKETQNPKDIYRKPAPRVWGRKWKCAVWLHPGISIPGILLLTACSWIPSFLGTKSVSFQRKLLPTFKHEVDSSSLYCSKQHTLVSNNPELSSVHTMVLTQGHWPGSREPLW